MATSTKSHYESHSNDSYEDAFFYEPGAYQDWLVDAIRARLNHPKRLLDVGGGTGNFTQRLNTKAVVVDPYLEASNEENGKECKKQNNVRFVKAAAEEFANNNNNKTTEGETEWWKKDFDAVLLKEVVHHFAQKDRVAIFRGLRKSLLPGGTLLIVTRPQHTVDYPLWDAARDVWARDQPGSDVLMNELRLAGFGQVNVEMEAYPCSVSLNRWQSMVRKRFWSTFAKFSDQELDDACKLLEKKEQRRIRTDDKGEQVIDFEDRLLFISCCQSG